MWEGDELIQMFLHSEMPFGDHSEVHGQRSIKAEVMVLSSAAQKEKQGSQCPAFEAEAPHDCNIQLKMAPDFLLPIQTNQDHAKALNEWD